MPLAVDAGEFKESDHPRDKGGQFVGKGAGVTTHFAPPGRAAKLLSGEHDFSQSSPRTWQGAGVYLYPGKAAAPSHATFGGQKLYVEPDFKNPFVGSTEEIERKVDQLKSRMQPPVFQQPNGQPVVMPNGEPLRLWGPGQENEALRQEWLKDGHDGLVEMIGGRPAVMAVFDPNSLGKVSKAEDQQGYAAVDAGEFRESEHPRDKGGQFTAKGQKFYHGTSSGALERIKQEGINPAGPQGHVGTPGTATGEHSHVSSDPGTANRYANWATPIGQEPALLEIEFPENTWLEDDPTATAAHRYRGAIKPEWITRIARGGVWGDAMPLATDPPVSERQRRAMWAAASGKSNLGIPKKVGEEFVGKADAADAEERKRDELGRFAAGSGGGSFTSSQEFSHKKNLASGYKHEGQLPSGHHVYTHQNYPGKEFHISPSGFRSSHQSGGGASGLVIGGRGSKDEALDQSGLGFLGTLKTFLRDLLAWASEEEGEAEHTDVSRETSEAGDRLDAALPLKPEAAGSAAANDAALARREVMALDRASLRSKDVDGRLHLETSNISKATVNPYRGEEIPDYERLGLDGDKIYQLLRPPDELAKAADSFNNLPILSKHIPVSADAHQPDLVIGSTGTDACFEPPYLKNSLVFWAGDAIDAIESEEQRELSSAYRYTADMTPGTFEGQHYDGIMRDIVGNHVALVTEGRAGSDVAVGDSMDPKLKEEIMKVKLSPTVLAGVKKALAGVTLKNGKKLAQDANIDEILPLIETIIGQGEGVADQGAMTMPSSGVPATVDEAAIRRDCRAADARRRLGRDETDEERDKREAEDAAADAAEKDDNDDKTDKAEDEEKDDDKAKDERAGLGAAGKAAQDRLPKNLVTKGAMDAAVTAAVNAALDRAASTQREIRDAERAVRPYVGELAMAHDSAEGVYRTALTALGVKLDGVHPSAFATILGMQPKAGAHAAQAAAPPAVAMDAAQAKSFAERFPGADKIAIL